MLPSVSPLLRRFFRHAMSLSLETGSRLFNGEQRPVTRALEQAHWRRVASFARVYRVGVWFGVVRSALLLAVVLCWVDCSFWSWVSGVAQVLLGLLCFLRVTHWRRSY